MINPIAVKLGPLSIHWYAICIVSGLLLAVYLTRKEAPRKKIKSDDILDFILLAFPIAIIGARLYYVVFNWDYYGKNPSEILITWHGGIAIYGGLIAGTIVLFIFSYYRMIKPIDFLDIAVPGVMIAQSIGRWGNFFNQEAYGKAVSQLNYLPDFIRKQMFTDGHYRTPTFLYESLWSLLGFILIIALRHRPKLFKEGEITFFYLIWYGCGRFVIEGMRTDSLMLMGLRVSQWLSALLVIFGIAMVFMRRRNKELAYY
ncbi:prolipoprotein diacylglyceryl transferase [Streptococcus macacae]|uniref:Phosphatidylglycerol--prolipoprotein diacylglyceryl transferase n=1 Tax=Streptococcus macacae NCTC 11558 TaxID=764298 RepID=G5JYM4_9STRE|nr:prolipoprotein diacylglyceryl transferase [Streptococcus macacae]EHJ52157.1 prolipoprotein diacylglyceryl transferase [Streptococcus macacae NCTC 11558]SUN78137.1 prolipoprotein diacylglycerol transferase [Streptococcus macacae NCTC 11558]